MKRNRFLRFGAALLCVCVSVLTLSAAGAAGLTTHLIVETAPLSAEQTRQILTGDYVIDNRRGNVFRLYLEPDAWTALQQQGFSGTVVGQDPAPPPPPGKAGEAYHTYATLTTQLEQWAQQYPALCRLVDVGVSLGNRHQWAMIITDQPDTEEDEPEVKYVGSIHGDELVGMEMCLKFIQYLLENHAADARVRQLVDNTELWVMPVMNPDGLANNSRFNGHGKDLNRYFPSYPTNYNGTIFTQAMSTLGREPEVANVMRWIADHSFTLSAQFHGGALVANYPYDDDQKGSVDSPAPDDLLLEYLSRRYSQFNTPMWNSTVFTDGITNGAAWYAITGGMQDWNYRYMGCVDITLEIGDIKQPPVSEMATYWGENRESMLYYAEAAQLGLRGLVTDAVTGEPVWARITLAGNSQPVYTDPAVGDYHRMLLPGTYTVSVDAPGYATQTTQNVVVATGAITRLNVALVSAGDDARFHSADGNRNHTVELSELQTCTALYSAGAYHADTPGVFLPGAGIHSGAPHSADRAPADWKISFSELLRVIQIHNAGGYTSPATAAEGEGASEDGFSLTPP